MIKVTVEFWSSGKVINRNFSTQVDAKKFLCRLSGSNFLGYLDDGTFAVYVGE